MNPGTVLQGRYRLLDLLGEGGMGKVYRAEGLHLNRPFAVKQLKGPAPDDPAYASYLKAFRSEAELLAGLHHPRLPRVVDFFEEQASHFVVMDFVDGQDLGKALDAGQVFEPEQVRSWALEVLEVLEYLHSRQPPVIVRDLKPSNLIRTPDGHLTLVDFGIARALEPSTRTATLAAGMGTPGYAPPEQYASGQSDPRSDLYALGATLYHLVTGQPPLESVQVAAGLARQLPPSHWRPVPADLEAGLMRALACRLDERHASAAAMRAALLSGSPEDSDARSRAADARPAEEGQPPLGRLLTRIRERFLRLGWRERQLEGFELAMDGPGLVTPLLLVRCLPGEPDEAGFVDQVRAVLPPARLSTVYLVLPAQRFPNPVSVQHEARQLSRLGMMKRLLILPVDLSRKKLLDGYLQPNDNDLEDPLLNLAAAVGTHQD